MDFNDLLRNTKTAAEEDKAAVKVPLAGHKRGAESKESASATTADVAAKRVRRGGAVEGLNLQAAQDALALERGSSSAHAQQQRVQADLLSEQAAARMVHQVVDYVLQVELGGRHNASKGGVPPFVPTGEQLAAERAMWTTAAGYSVHHIVPAASDAATATLETLMSVTEKERVPDGIRMLRSSLQICNVEADLVGGVRSGMAPHLRAHVLEVLERGLRGEAWLRDDTNGATFFDALGKPTTPEKGPSSVLLFRDSAPSVAAQLAGAGEGSDSGTVAGNPYSAGAAADAPLGGFSLSAFLHENTSSKSSSDEDGEG
ncbi:hypothetical protein ABB37_01795 [Leptomonas pyrrhocoris]|uniref:Uncharacterized protein n=1 Tax=Leptomonas pyrrhocoris TaxID=157538 RepID=A0A0N0VHI5_LEPPY|nr:hypothetical protein ABB37_01795 [Leptomonas pyrrhocoris]KPA85521.1 hypothetical protein ABB37_01795 [Leptomonas pyrrhocoris]|eukprot:XP_015663960.1 hypothetical protein ABB37_01795 [Leptomonas pyrrhocoris]